MSKKIFTIIICLCMLILFSTNAYAYQINNNGFTSKDERIQEITQGIFNCYKNHENVDNYLVNEGLQKVNSDTTSLDAVSPSSASTQITIDKPIIYYDPGTGEYVVNSHWQWNRDSYGVPYWNKDINSVGNVGGYEAAGIWISNPTGIRLDKQYMDTYDYHLNSYYFANAWDWNQYGVVFKNQDVATQDYTVPGHFNYNFDSGTIVLWTVVSGTGSTYLKTTFAHDWSSSQIQNISISNTGISATFAPTTYAWQGTSQPYTWTR